MSKIQKLIEESQRELERKLDDYTRSLIGKRVHLFHKSSSGPNFDRRMIVKEIIRPKDNLFSPPLFLVKDHKGVLTCVHKDTEVTIC